MRRALRSLAAFALCLTLLACGLHLAHSGQEEIPPRREDALRIATHNVHYILLRQQSGRWSVGDWEARKPALDAAFKTMEADLVAFQEMESFAGASAGGTNLALDHLLAENPGYAAAAVGDWRDFPSTQPILYRTDRLRLLDQGWFFFSETPEVIYSRTFNGSYPAFASWARFAPKGPAAPFTLVNVHFDRRSWENRRRSAEMVRDAVAGRIAEGETVVLAGDLNALTGRPTMELLKEAGLSFLPVEGATYHFDRGINLYGAIDHLGVSEGVALAAGPVVLRRRFAGDWPSDHYPVLADIVLPVVGDGPSPGAGG